MKKNNRINTELQSSRNSRQFWNKHLFTFSVTLRWPGTSKAQSLTHCTLFHLHRNRECGVVYGCVVMCLVTCLLARANQSHFTDKYESLIVFFFISLSFQKCWSIHLAQTESCCQSSQMPKMPICGGSYWGTEGATKCAVSTVVLVINSNDVLPLSFLPADGNRSTVLGNYRPPSGSFMKSSAVTTSVDAIWRGREHCYFSIGEGIRHPGSIKTIMAFLSKCWAMPGTTTRKVGIPDWRILGREEKKGSREKKRRHIPSWLTITQRNIAFYDDI